MGDNDEQPADKEVTKANWFKKPKQPPTPDPDWSKRRQVNFRPPQTWISQAALAEEPPTSFDEFNDTSFDFSTFVMNRLKILNLTQEILVGSAFNLLKGTCKSITELEYDKYGYIKNHKKIVKNGQARTRERKSVQKPEASVKEKSTSSQIG
ncbi:hypothetical protein Tco_1487974 [Tanacetum coccineum]